MIKPEHVPDEATNALLMALRLRKGGKEAIAAAINAWPGMECRPTFGPSRVILPLSQDAGDE